MSGGVRKRERKGERGRERERERKGVIGEREIKKGSQRRERKK